jgi:hypothetical protein
MCQLKAVVERQGSRETVRRQTDRRRNLFLIVFSPIRRSVKSGADGFVFLYFSSSRIPSNAEEAAVPIRLGGCSISDRLTQNPCPASIRIGFFTH